MLTQVPAKRGGLRIRTASGLKRAERLGDDWRWARTSVDNDRLVPASRDLASRNFGSRDFTINFCHKPAFIVTRRPRHYI
jgi:hypothetical protein